MCQCVSGSLNPNLFTVNVAVFTEPINSWMVGKPEVILKLGIKPLLSELYRKSAGHPSHFSQTYMRDGSKWCEA